MNPEMLTRFEALCMAHGLTANAREAMRGLLLEAHTAGYAKHMNVAAQIAADADEEEDSLPDGLDEEA